MIMLVVGMIGLLANLYAVLILRKEAAKASMSGRPTST